MIESDEHSSLLHYIYETDPRFFLAETCLLQVNIFAPKKKIVFKSFLCKTMLTTFLYIVAQLVNFKL
jgi:hypothetical protein